MNNCIFCGYADKRECNYCPRCGRLGDVLYRKIMHTEEGRAALVKACTSSGLPGQQLELAKALDENARLDYEFYESVRKLSI